MDSEKKEAVLAFNDGNLSKCLEILLRIHEWDPSDHRISNNIQAVKFKLSKSAESVPAVKLGKECTADSSSSKSSLLLKNEEPSSSMQLSQRDLWSRTHMQGDDPCSLFNKSLVYFQTGDYAQCLDIISISDPPFEKYAFQMILLAFECHMALGNINGARHVVENARIRYLFNGNHNDTATNVFKISKDVDLDFNETLRILQNRLDVASNQIVQPWSPSSSKCSNILSSILASQCSDPKQAVLYHMATHFTNLKDFGTPCSESKCVELQNLGILNCRWKRYTAGIILLQNALEMSSCERHRAIIQENIDNAKRKIEDKDTLKE